VSFTAEIHRLDRIARGAACGFDGQPARGGGTLILIWRRDSVPDVKPQLKRSQLQSNHP
jgi:hypothetical protein